MISAVILIDTSGDIIAKKVYRRDFNPLALENYRLSVITSGEITTPIHLIDGCSFLHHFENEIYYVGCVQQNSGADIIFELLTRLPDIFAKVLDLPEINVKKARDYVADIVEILDEIIDAGYPQNTDPEALKYLTGHASKEVTQPSNNVTVMATGPIPWRATNIVHKPHQFYVDVVEKVSLLVTPDHKILNKCVNGTTTMKTQLSGMPQCTLTFNNKLNFSPEKMGSRATTSGIDFDDIIFHQCVKLDKFPTTGEITFIPPDGEFEFMRYRKTENVGIPFNIVPIINDPGGNKLDISVTVEATYDSKLIAVPFCLTIPLPMNTAVVTIEAPDKSKAKYVETQNAVVWKIPAFVGQSSAQIAINVQYLNASSKSSTATKMTQPISAQFCISKFSVSGLALASLQTSLDKERQPEVFIRYTTTAGKYQVMIPGTTESI